MGWIELSGMLMGCITVVVCFLIRAGHGKDVESIILDLHEVSTELATAKEDLKALQEIVAKNAVVLTRLANDNTNAAAIRVLGRGK